MEPYPEFAALLNHWLTVHDRTPNWLAHKLKCHSSTVHRWSTQATRPADAATVQAILDVLGIHNPQDRQALFAAADYSDPAPTSSTSATPLPGQSANPTPPVYDFATYDAGWVGRKALVQELNEQIQSGRRLILLTGMAGIGKTALAERLALVLTPWLLTPTSVSRLNFDHHEPGVDFASVASRWLEEWGEQVASEERRSPTLLMRHLLQILSSRRRLIIIDALEKAISSENLENNQRNRLTDEGWEQFFHSLLSAETLASRVIVTTQDLPEQVARFGAEYPSRWLRKELSGLSKTEQEALFQKFGFSVSDDHQARVYLTRISQAYAGHPLALRTIIGEIVNEFASDVSAYWQEYGHEIETVEHDLVEAQKTGRTQAADDNWQLDRFSVELQRQVRHRLDYTFARLRQHAPDAYLLICTAAEYRSPVKARFWLQQLALRGKNEQQQQAALQTLRDRSLLEQSLDKQGNRLFGLHNLIRSVALEHHDRLFLKNSPQSTPREVQ